MDKDSKERVKRENTERRREKRTEKKVEYGRCLLIFLVIQFNREGQKNEKYIA